MFIACKMTQDKTTQNPASGKGELPVMTDEQSSAFESLNIIQTFSDSKNRFYSTFPDIDHPAYPPDTSIVISQSDFLFYLKEFMKEHSTNIESDIQKEIAESSVKAQQEYTVLFCLKDASIAYDFKNGIPMHGIWVIPNVLQRRDVIIVW